MSLATGTARYGILCAMENKRKIPYGVINWAKLVRECLFVDNTTYIRKLEDVDTPVFLRPKRFGKSVVCSMLAHYYDIALKDRFDDLFGRTDIGRNPTPLRNSFLVLTFDFSTVEVGTLAEIERNFWRNVQSAVGSFTVKYRELADWSKVETATRPADCIDCVREVIRKNHLSPLYVIIDEYDNFTNELVVSNRDLEYNAVCGHDSRGDATRESFFKAFFKSFKAGLADGTVGRTYFLKPTVLGDLERFYDGYRFTPGAGHLFNSTICNWYLQNLVAERRIPWAVIDANVRTDIGWFRRLAQTDARALEKVRAYVERGEGEIVNPAALSAKFGRAKFFSEEFFPYALYYLGLLTFESRFSLKIPNLTIKNMFVDYYDELSEFTNVDEARRAFGLAAEALALNGGTWKNLFDAYWLHYVKARIPAQAFDKMNENFFRTTFTSRCLDYLVDYYSFETEYNSSEGRCDFLAIPKPGVARPAQVIEFKYFTNAAAEKGKVLGRGTPDAETVEQALAYRTALARRPDWNHPIAVTVVEVCGNVGYNWFDL